MEEKQEEVKLPYLVEWLIKNKSLSLGGVLTLLILCFLLFRPSSSMPYFESERLSSLWNEKKQKKYLDELLLSLDKKSSLQLKYQGLITDNYLMNKDFKGVEKGFSKSSLYLKRVFPFHDEFSKNTLLLETGREKEALESSIALEKKLKKANLEDSFLYEYNLLRIALLHQRLGSCEKELFAYKMMKNQGKKLPFAEKELTFSDYMTKRMVKLRN